MRDWTFETAKPGPIVLVTGFGPFPGFPHNVSADVAKAVVNAAAIAIPDVRFEAAILPVDWERAPALLTQLYERFHPVVSVHFGVAAGIPGFRLERCAANFCRPLEDEIGCLPASSTLSDTGPQERQATLPLDVIAARLSALGLPVSLSDDAGGYLCNALFFHALDSERHSTPHEAAFVHIPPDLSGPPFDFASAVLGGVEIVRCALEAASASGGTH